MNLKILWVFEHLRRFAMSVDETIIRPTGLVLYLYSRPETETGEHFDASHHLGSFKAGRISHQLTQIARCNQLIGHSYQIKNFRRSMK